MVGLLGVTLALFLTQPAGADSTFSDPSGDTSGAPDITTVVVSDESAGRITFRISFANQPELAADSQLNVWLDTDLSDATGSQGLDYLIVVVGASRQFDVARWNGSDWDYSVPSSTVSVSFRDGVTISVGRSELGGTSGFNFLVGGVQGVSGQAGNIDYGPDSGRWSYRLSAPPPPPPPPSVVRLVFGNVVTVPTKPTAGKPFTLTFGVTRSDTGASVAKEAVTAVGTFINGKSLRLPVRFGFVGAKMRMTLAVPKTAKGKLLRVTITVVAVHRSATKVVTFKVR